MIISLVAVFASLVAVMLCIAPSSLARPEGI